MLALVRQSEVKQAIAEAKLSTFVSLVLSLSKEYLELLCVGVIYLVLPCQFQIIKFFPSGVYQSHYFGRWSVRPISRVSKQVGLTLSCLEEVGTCSFELR